MSVREEKETQMKENEEKKVGEKNPAWREAGAPPSGMKKRKRKGIRPIYAGKNQFREKV